MTLTASPTYGAYRAPVVRKRRPQDGQPLRSRGYRMLRVFRIPRAVNYR